MMGLEDGTSGRGPTSAASVAVGEVATVAQIPHTVRAGTVS